MFSLAGIWESGGTSPGSIGTFVILTMAAEPEIADIHHRQPVILDEEAKEQWLTPGWGSDALIRIARKGYKGAYDRWCVNRDVNNPRNDSPELLLPLWSGSALPAASAIA